VEAADVIDCLGVAQCGALFEPGERRRLILGNAVAERQRRGIIDHGPIESALGGDAKAFGGAALVDRDSPAEIVAAAEHVEAHQMARLRGLAEPDECRDGIARDAGTVEQHLAIDRLCFGHAGFGAGADQLDAILGRFELPRHLLRRKGVERAQYLKLNVANAERPGAIVA